MKKLKKILALSLTAVMALSFTVVASASDDDIDWPTKAIEVIVPASPGGDSDTTCRAICESLTDILGQPVTVTNMQGGAGTVAMTELLNRDADGYTLIYHHVDTLLLELLGRMDEGWTWEDNLDIAAVCGGGNSYCLFAHAGNEQGIEDFDTFLAYAQENPGELNYALEMGSTLHMHALAMMNALDIDVNCVDLGSASDRTVAFLGGEADLLEGLYSQGEEYVESGDFIPLFFFGNERNENFPDIPCSGELGFDFDAEWFYYFGFKKGTDPEIVDKFADAVGEAVMMEPYQEALALYDFHDNYLPEEEGEEFMENVMEVYRPMAEEFLNQ